MGYCCMPFRVDFKELRRLRRSRDAAFLERVVAVAAQRGLDVNDDDDPDHDGDDLEGAALHRFLNGQPPDPNHPSVHEFIVACACTLSGDAVDDGFLPLKWITTASEAAVAGGGWRGVTERVVLAERVATEHIQQHFNDVDAALETHGLGSVLSSRRLFAGGYPSSLSVLALEHKSVGYLTAEATRRAHEALVSTEWKDLSRQVQATLSVVMRALAAGAAKGHGTFAEVSWLLGSTHLLVSTLDVPRVEALRGSRSEVFPERLACFFDHKAEYTATGHALSDDEFLAWRQTHFPKDAVEEPAPDLPAILRAVWEILHRSRLCVDRGDQYVAALQLICIAIGEGLDNQAVAPAAPAHFSAVDAALEAAGLADIITMQQLVFGGAPIAIPESDDFPAVGHLSPAKVRQARGLIASRDWSAEPPEVQATLRQVDGWLGAAAAHKQGLVCFYS